MKDVENTTICAACGGRCCKILPGSLSPTDLNDVEKDLFTLLSSGHYAIDWWEGDPRPGHDEVDKGYFIRPATKNKPGRLFDPSWGGECIFLTSDGCLLPLEKRPSNCRVLVPKKDGNCFLPKEASKREIAISWIPYHEVIMEVVLKIKTS